MAYVQYIVIAILILIFALLLRSKSMVIQRFAALEIATILVVAIGFFAVCNITSNFREETYADYSGKSLSLASDLLMNLDEYEVSKNQSQTLQNDIISNLNKIYGEGTYERVSVLETDNDGYGVILAVGKAGNVKQENYYKSTVFSMIKVAIEKRTISAKMVSSSKCVVVAADSDSKIAKRVIVVELSATGLSDEKEAFANKATVYALVIWFASSILMLLIVLIQDLEWKKMIRTIERISISKEGWRKPPIHSNEMQLMWNSIGEILKNVSKANYEKFKTFQVYYRFAPKKIEKILDKPSINDVYTGDVADMRGALALWYLSGDEKLKKKDYVNNMNKKFNILSQNQEKHEGIFLSADNDLRRQNFMFVEDPTKAILFGVEACMSFEEEKIYSREKGIVLIHHSDFTYGICGNDEQAAISVVSDDMSILQKYLKKLSMNGVRMVVTDSVPEQIRQRYSARYIGYVDDSGRSFKLYEVLDAYPDKERRVRMKTNDRLQQALSLFYKNDFYLARNAFSDVLRECPSDGLAKWYVFRCEDYLNKNGAEESSFALFSKDE